MLKIAASLMVILAASVLYLQAAEPAGLCAVIDHPYLCGEKTSGVTPLGIAAAD